MIRIRDQEKVTSKLPNGMSMPPEMSEGTAMSREPCPSATQFCRKIDMPMAEMSATRRGPPRTGR